MIFFSKNGVFWVPSVHCSFSGLYHEESGTLNDQNESTQQEALMKTYPNSCGEDVQKYSQHELTQKVGLYQLYKWSCNPYAL